jgi:hypothetical protein
MADDVEGIRAFDPAPGVDPIHRVCSHVEAGINRSDRMAAPAV